LPFFFIFVTRLSTYLLKQTCPYYSNNSPFKNILYFVLDKYDLDKSDIFQPGKHKITMIFIHRIDHIEPSNMGHVDVSIM